MKDKRIDIIMEYLGLDGEFITDCFGDFDDEECKECNSFRICFKEMNIRKKLKEVKQ